MSWAPDKIVYNELRLELWDTNFAYFIAALPRRQHEKVSSTVIQNIIFNF